MHVICILCISFEGHTINGKHMQPVVFLVHTWHQEIKFLNQTKGGYVTLYNYDTFRNVKSSPKSWQNQKKETKKTKTDIAKTAQVTL